MKIKHLEKVGRILYWLVVLLAIIIWSHELFAQTKELKKASKWHNALRYDQGLVIGLQSNVSLEATDNIAFQAGYALKNGPEFGTIVTQQYIFNEVEVKNTITELYFNINAFNAPWRGGNINFRLTYGDSKYLPGYGNFKDRKQMFSCGVGITQTIPIKDVVSPMRAGIMLIQRKNDYAINLSLVKIFKSHAKSTYNRNW